MVVESKDVTIIDADGLILGRMASLVAQRLLKGEKIIIVNAEKAVISGNKNRRVIEAKKFLSLGHPKAGPFYYRKPDRMLRKTVRGMLPYKKPKGQQALKRLKVMIRSPKDLNLQHTETLKKAQVQKLTCARFTLGELAKGVGWKSGVD